MQAAEARFRRWMTTLLLFFVLVGSYFVLADRYAPMTTESRVQGFVVPLATEVSGHITAVYSENNQAVKAGELLFSIDDTHYRLVHERAQLALRQAYEQEAARYADVTAAKAKIETYRVTADNAMRDFKRIERLARSGSVSKSQFDNAESKRDASAANLRAARAQLRALEVRLGDGIGHSSVVLAAQNALAQAKWDLSRTQVLAPSDGVVSNLQLHEGAFASANQPILTFIPADSLWLVADFREKATALMKPGETAEVAFDALPGKVFTLSLLSRDFGVASAQQQANGRLSAVETSNRWVRDAQRVRVNLESEEALPANLFVGSRATVVVYTESHSLFTWLAEGMIRLISIAHYLY
ncbi:multidrug resistance efflux pump [Sinobacterium caligoides]|uniref:Multidrug resistance efflux pump n=1 Tax=Sinobacterium caligoides TaxID=933926 RepID=A0A3N2DPJ4_9GAMM|nr:HlyD family secretion protein [Sinobacterium caligoides]ROS01622.1 multidrug resistance efflux pump [Sinobacterium caligoides]